MAADALTRLIAERTTELGWRPGTRLENQVACLLSRFHAPAAVQQHRVGKYRLDFAWPKVKIALEADGWYHRSPEGSARDAERDAWLRSQGWVVLRVDDRYGEEALQDQMVRVCRIVRGELCTRGCRWDEVVFS
jgi:very-short-patch-repair endonuclease